MMYQGVSLFMGLQVNPRYKRDIMATETLQIQAQERTNLVGSYTSKLRKDGFIPGVIYGKKGTLAIAVPFKSFPKNHTASTPIKIDVGGSSKTVLMREVQADTITTLPLHVDFQEVAPNDVIKTKVPVEYVGLTKEQEKEASFKILRRSIEVKGALAKLPTSVQISVGHLKSGEAIHASDAKLPDGVKLREHAGTALATLLRI